MKASDKEKAGMIIIIILCCVIMALVETVIEPAYIVKSAVKAAVFLLLPSITLKVLNIKVFDRNFTLNKKDIIKLLALGLLIYGAIVGVFFLTRNVFDYSALVDSQMADQKINSGSFIWVASYVSFGNSFLEEFLFRFIAFIKLSEYMSKRFAYIFSSVMFAVYHIAMIGASFPLPLLLLSLFVLAVGGFIFDLVDSKNMNIYYSWFIHMFADIAIMTVWYIHI